MNIVRFKVRGVCGMKCSLVVHLSTQVFSKLPSSTYEESTTRSKAKFEEHGFEFKKIAFMFIFYELLISIPLLFLSATE